MTIRTLILAILLFGIMAIMGCATFSPRPQDSLHNLAVERIAATIYLAWRCVPGSTDMDRGTQIQPGPESRSIDLGGLQARRWRQEDPQTIEHYLDGTSFVLDQSLRGILGGLGPDDLCHFVKLPKYLYEAPPNLQSYGEISSYPPAIFYQTVGWYDNDAANLEPLAPVGGARQEYRSLKCSVNEL